MENTGLITLEYVKTIIKERPRDTHKGQCGRVLIIAGSVGMAGAAVLATRGALKSGAGLVTAAVPAELFVILQTAVPQAMCIDRLNGLSSRPLESFDSIAIGPGLGVDEKNYRLLNRILKEFHGTVVIDADGLNTLCQFDSDLRLLQEREAPSVLTPHPGEADRLLRTLGKAQIKESGRQMAAETIAAQTGAVVLLKGADTLVASRGQTTYSNMTGNPGMATGGSGDVLSGVIAAIAASGVPVQAAAKAGAFLHGLAGDLAAEKIGQWGMTAVDIEESLPAAFKKVVGK